MQPDQRTVSLMLAVFGVVLVFMFALLGLGLVIDLRFGTKPLATLVLSLVGLHIGLIAAYRMVMTQYVEIERAVRRASANSPGGYREEDPA